MRQPLSERRAIKDMIWRYPKTGDHIEKRKRIQDTDVLVRFAIELADAAEQLSKTNRVFAAVLYRDALQIMLLALRSMRLKNFYSLRIGIEIKCIDGVWQLDIPKNATKRCNPFDPIIPQRIVPFLLRYLGHYRLALLTPEYSGDRLWVTTRGGPQAARSIFDQIAKRTKARFGHSMSPHMFRDAVMTTVATQMPESVRMGAALLGNRGQEAGELHYNLSQRADAEARYNAALDALEAFGDPGDDDQDG